jgi:hypothetical protein
MGVWSITRACVNVIVLYISYLGLRSRVVSRVDGRDFVMPERGLEGLTERQRLVPAQPNVEGKKSATNEWNKQSH